MTPTDPGDEPTLIYQQPHIYLSTGCLHGHHNYCRSMTGYQGEKRPSQCKFCTARCACPCHEAGFPDGA